MSSTEVSSSQASQSKLQRTTASLQYLYDPSKGQGPTRRRTRLFLRSARYILVFLFYRALRSIKYAAIGALTAAVAGTALGTLTGGVGFVLAPPGILGGAGVGLLWGMGKMGWRVLASRVRHGDVNGSAREDERESASKEERAKVQQERIREKGADVDPW